MPIITGIKKDKATITLDIEILKWIDSKVGKNEIPSRSYFINKCVKERMPKQ